jgi:hypothetical protein
MCEQGKATHHDPGLSSSDGDLAENGDVLIGLEKGWRCW